MKRLFGLILFMAALFSPAHSYAYSINHAPNIILITLDGTRWQDIFYGTDPNFYHGAHLSAREIMPNVYRTFVDGGMVIGRNSEMDIDGPSYKSLPGYLEILRGHPTEDCYDNECHPNMSGSILDWVAEEEHTNNIGIIASWNRISRLSSSSQYVVNAGRRVRQNWTGINDMRFPNYFVEGDRADQFTEAAALQYYLEHHPRFMWLSLGDTDEFLHRRNYNGYIKSLQEFDKFFETLMELAQMIDEKTVVIMTTDHGRNNDVWNHGFDPASRRVWMMIAGPSIPAVGFVDLKMTITSANIYGMIQAIVRSGE